MNETYLINWSLINSPIDKCNINQAQMLSEVQRLPSSAYYILLGGLVALLFYFFIQPYLNQKINDALERNIGVLGVCLVFLASWVLAIYTFKLGEEQLNSISKAASFLIVPLLLLLSYVAYRRYWK